MPRPEDCAFKVSIAKADLTIAGFLRAIAPIIPTAQQEE
jgi:hypothetical protein